MNEPVFWTPMMRLAVVPVVISGVLGLLVVAVLTLGLLLLGLKPTRSL